MPPLDHQLKENKPFLLRELLYGPPKTKKTWWACKAAEAGFNVILLDCDDGAHILSQIAPEARHRIANINIVDTLTDPVACKFTTLALAGRIFLWDEQDKDRVIMPANRNMEHSFYYINANKLTRNDILVVDSWTKLVKSLAWRWYKENGIDITSGEQAKSTNWDGYRWSGEMASWMVRQLKALPCHVMVIGHKSVYEKYKNEVINGKKVSSVEWQRTQIVSTSGPHGMTIASDFSDILQFYLVGSIFKIDTTPYADADGGSRLIPPKVWRWEELQFVDICNMVGIPVPDNAPPQEFAKWYDIGDKIDLGGIEITPDVKPSAKGVIATTSLLSKKPKSATFNNLLKKEAK